MKLVELKARKSRVEQLISLLSTLREEKGEEASIEAQSDSLQPKEVSVSAQPAQDLVGNSELEGGPDVAVIQEKLRQAEEARQKVHELQEMIAQLQELSLASATAEAAASSEIQRRKADGKAGEARERERERERGEREELRRQMASLQKKLLGATPPAVPLEDSTSEEEEEGEKEEEGGSRGVMGEEEENSSLPDLDITLPESEGGETHSNVLERSLVLDYQQQLAEKRLEVLRLQRQREELLSTQRRLMRLQEMTKEQERTSRTQPPTAGLKPRDQRTSDKAGARPGEKTTDEGVVVPSQLAAGLERQRRLYDQLLEKTRQLRRMQAMMEQSEKASDQPEADVTAATWGGSTAMSETNSTVSVPDLNTTLESLEPGHTHGESAAVEQPGGTVATTGGLQFRVTRHTPRPPRGQRRVLTPPAEDFASAGKKRKLDTHTPVHITTSAAGVPPPPSATTYSAVWPGVIFPSQQHSFRNTQDEATQTAVPALPHSQHTALLEHQLAISTSMCQELLYSQNTLVHTVCQRLDRLDLDDTIQQHMAHLYQYRNDLEQYRGRLFQAWTDLTEQVLPTVEDGLDEQGEDQEEPVAQNVERESEREETSSAAAAPNAGVSGAPTEPNTAQSLQDGPQEQSTQTEREIPLASHASLQQPPPQGYYGGFESSYGYGYVPEAHSNQRWSYPPGRYGAAYQQPPSDVDSSYLQPEPPATMVPPPPPPPPPPLSFPPSHFSHPLGFHPWPSPHHYLPGLTPPFSHLHPYTSYGPPPPFLSARYSQGQMHPSHPASHLTPELQRHRWSFAPHLSGYTPQYGYPSTGATPLLHQYQLYQPGAYLSGDDFTTEGRQERDHLRSPSGITAASVQVQPPSSPPSVPSMSNLPQTSSFGSLGHQQLMGDAYSPNSTGSTLRVPSASHPHNPPSTSSRKPPLTLLSPLTTATSTKHTSRASAAASLAERGREAALAELKENTRTEALMSGPQTDQQQEVESLSSLPPSLPDEGMSGALLQPKLSAQSSEPPAEFSVFDALRDTIYSEVATLIATNETRPHFLVELFRELQLLRTDYLRQRALYALQDLVTRFLTEENMGGEGNQATAGMQYQSWLGSASEHTPSESVATTDDEAVRPKPPQPLTQTSSTGFDYAELADSASSLSTPPVPDDPFASDNLGDTVIRLDKAMARMRESYASGASPQIKPPAVSPGPVAGDHASESSQSEGVYSDLDTQVLDEEIKSVMTEVIPVLKEHLQSECSLELLGLLQRTILSLVLRQEGGQGHELMEVFSKQLEATLNSTLAKYLNKKLKECGEDLLVDVSEVLFNELAFFRLLQEIKLHPGGPDLKSMTSNSQTTTENEDSALSSPSKPTTRLPGVVPPLLEALGSAVADSLREEEEALGKSRDDELAQTWDSKIQEHTSSMSAENDQTLKVELSISETKPLESTGSGEEEEEEEEEGEEKEGEEEGERVTPQQMQPEQAPEGQTHKEEDRDATPQAEPPPPITTLTTTTTRDHAPSTEDHAPSEEQDHKMSGGEEGAGGGTESALPEGEDQVGEVDHPVGLATITQAALEAQVKAEQQSTEGLVGILASVEQGQELAGDGNELPQPVTAEP